MKDKISIEEFVKIWGKTPKEVLLGRFYSAYESLRNLEIKNNELKGKTSVLEHNLEENAKCIEKEKKRIFELLDENMELKKQLAEKQKI